MSFLQKFAPPIFAGVVGVGIAIYTLKPALDNMKREEDQHKEEIRQVIAKQDEEQKNKR